MKIASGLGDECSRKLEFGRLVRSALSVTARRLVSVLAPKELVLLQCVGPDVIA